MKKILICITSLVVIFLVSCQSRVTTLQYYLHNMTGQEIVISSDESKMDTVAAAGYYLLWQEQVGDCEKYSANLNDANPLFIYLNGECYQVDRNNANSCLWSDVYNNATNEDATKLANDNIVNAFIKVYDLTVENITSQIHKQ